MSAPALSRATKLSSKRGGTVAASIPSTPGNSAAKSGGRVAVHHHAHVVALDQRIHYARCLRDAVLQPALVHACHRDAVGMATHGFAQHGGRALVEQPPLVQQYHFVTTFRFVEVRGGEQHAGALFTHQAIDDLPQFAARQRVHADRGFVEQQQRGLSHQRTGEAKFLFHAAGKLAGQSFGKWRKPRHVHELAVTFCTCRFGHALQVGVEVEVLLHGKIFVKAEALRHVTDGALHRERLRSGIHAEHADGAAIRHQQSCREAHQCGLAGGVGADQPGDHAVAHAEADVMQCLDLALADAEGFGELIYDQCDLAVRARGSGGRRVVIGRVHANLTDSGSARCPWRRVGPARSLPWPACRGAIRPAGCTRRCAPGRPGCCAPRWSPPISA